MVTRNTNLLPETECHNSEQVKQKAPSLGSILRNKGLKRDHTHVNSLI